MGKFKLCVFGDKIYTFNLGFEYFKLERKFSGNSQKPKCTVLETDTGRQVIYTKAMR